MDNEHLNGALDDKSRGGSTNLGFISRVIKALFQVPY